MVQQLFIEKDTRRKQASIGQAIVQAVRPRAVLAPLQLGLAVRMHHHLRSRFLIDNLAAMGYCSSYSEVQRFEEIAAFSTCPDVLGTANISEGMFFLAADNVYHNIVSLDGKGTLHGMGTIDGITPGQKISDTVFRKIISELQVTEKTHVDIIEYRFANHVQLYVKI